MTPDKDKPDKDKPVKMHGNRTFNDGRDDGASPEWATGLRQLYDSVVDEPLPDTFKDLLSKLDAKG